MSEGLRGLLVAWLVGLAVGWLVGWIGLDWKNSEPPTPVRAARFSATLDWIGKIPDRLHLSIQ